MSSAQREVKVGVLGATGTVGQRFITILASHPYFRIHALGASPRSAGLPYAKAVRWKQSTPIPESVAGIVLRECKEDQFQGCDVVFSGLDSDVAGDIESSFRQAELVVFSNASNYRRDPLCPLVVPLVNPSHFSILEHQKKTLGLKKGCIVTNANCSTTGIAIPFKALEDAFGPLETVMVTTMQAISGAGYPGVSSLDILDNVVPHIGGEEEKIEYELAKILGGTKDDNTAFDHHESSPMKVSAQCNRVPVLDGHMECCSVKFARQPAPKPEEVKEALRKWRCEAQELECPTAPDQAIFVHDAADRPQPRLDRYRANGAGVDIGRIRECPVLDLRFVVLSHNALIGAATSSIINAEIAVAKGII